MDGQYWVEVTDTNGCISRDSIEVSVMGWPQMDSIVYLCEGQVFTYQNQEYAAGEVISDTLNSLTGCDTIFTIQIEETSSPPVQIIGPDKLCPGERITLQIYQTGQGSVLWSTGATSDSIRVENEGFYWVEKHWTDGCTRRDSLFVEYYPIPEVVFEKEDESCLGLNDGEIRVSSGHSDQYQYFLDGEEVTGTAPSLSPDEYVMRVVNQWGCEQTDTLVIREGGMLGIGLGQDLKVTRSDSVIMIQVDVFQGSWSEVEWQINGRDTLITGLQWSMMVRENSEIVVEVRDENGCVGRDTMYISLEVSEEIYFPNIFSPNGDNINDEWRIYTSDPSIVIEELMIFDRWGELVFQTSDMNRSPGDISWDGRMNGEDCLAGVYVYVMTYSVNQRSSRRNGSISLVR